MMDDGRWKMEVRSWKMGTFKITSQKCWLMDNGRWEMGDGRWKMGDGRWMMEDGRWEMVDG